MRTAVCLWDSEAAKSNDEKLEYREIRKLGDKAQRTVQSEIALDD